MRDRNGGGVSLGRAGGGCRQLTGVRWWGWSWRGVRDALVLHVYWGAQRGVKRSQASAEPASVNHTGCNPWMVATNVKKQEGLRESAAGVDVVHRRGIPPCLGTDRDRALWLRRSDWAAPSGLPAKPGSSALCKPPTGQAKTGGGGGISNLAAEVCFARRFALRAVEGNTALNYAPVR